MEKKKFYKVEEKDLLDMLEAYERLTALEESGVDNWVWYEDSLTNRLILLKEEYGASEKKGFNFEDVAKIQLKNYEEIKDD